MASVLSIGIAVLDFVFQVDEMPTKPEKHRAKAVKAVGGGIAANAAVAVARQGGDSWLITRVGDDFVASDILTELEREKVNYRLSERFPGVKSQVSCILVDNRGERMIISYSDPDIPDGVDWLPKRLPLGIGCVLGDTRWETGAKHMFGLARAAGVPAVLDVDRKPKDLDLIRASTHPAFSAQACREMTGIDDVAKGAELLAKAFPGWLAVTDGPAGVYWTDGGVIRNSPAFKVEVVDTLGAGDTWHGAFALGLAEGMAPERAIRYASAVAALKCTRFGGRAGIPTRAEAEQFLKERS
jgi:sulfofructose kinase